MNKILRSLLTLSFASLLLASMLVGAIRAQQQTDSGDFSLQVTPSPLVTTIKPGQTTELELKIRNAGNQAENLKIEPRSFKVVNEEVLLDDTQPPDIKDWISFESPAFTVKTGEWFTQKVRLAIPDDAGFSYSFALLISRKDNPKPIEGGRLIKGSLAVFTLVNIDRPGASRKIDIGSFSVGKNMYEYLPADFDVQLKNSGNTIVQPYGNIFVQRSANDKSPISTLSVNETKGYILPDSTRTLKSQWTDGFPSYKTTTGEDGQTHRKLEWNWSKVSELRVGRYTAKLVAVYNDGQRDIPLESQVTFWVIPWKILGGLFIVLLLVLFGLWSLIRTMIRLGRRMKNKSK